MQKLQHAVSFAVKPQQPENKTSFQANNSSDNIGQSTSASNTVTETKRLTNPTRQTINVQLHLWKKFKSANDKVLNSGSSHHHDILMKKCLVLANGCMIFTEPNLKLLLIHDDEGHFQSKIYLSGRPFDLAIISSKLIAVSFGENRYVEIIDLTTKDAVKSFNWETNCFGIANVSNHLYVVIEGRGIVVLDHTTGQLIKTIPIKINQKTFLVVTHDSIIYTNWIFNTVYCFDLAGNEKWQFKKNKLHRPIGLTVNRNGDVFVAGNVSGNIYYISKDGKRSKELVRDKEIMDLYLDNQTYRLLTYKSDGSAFKYFVES